MDTNLEVKRKEENNAQRLEMMRKARKDAEAYNMQNYEKKAAQLEKKDKQKPVVKETEKPKAPETGGNNDWFDNIKTFGTDN